MLSPENRALVERVDPVFLNWLTPGGRSEQGVQRLLDAARAESRFELLKELKGLVFMARTSGGTGGRDPGLVSACELAEAAIASAEGLPSRLEKYGLQTINDPQCGVAKPSASLTGQEGEP